MTLNDNDASAMTARPRTNFFSACRRVTDWAIAFASSSNLLFIRFSRLISRGYTFIRFQWIIAPMRKDSIRDRSLPYQASEDGGVIILVNRCEHRRETLSITGESHIVSQEKAEGGKGGFEIK